MARIVVFYRPRIAVSNSEIIISVNKRYLCISENTTVCCVHSLMRPGRNWA